MKKHFRKTLVAAAVVGALASGISGTASAYEYAMSHLLVTDFTFSGSAATPESYTFNLTNTAILTGTLVGTSASCSGTTSSTTCSSTGIVLNAAAAENPIGVRSGENNFDFVGPGGTYASSDSVIYSAQLVNSGVPSSSEQIAEVNVDGNGTSLGNAELQSNTTVTFEVEVASTFDLNFFADPDLRAAINDPPGGIHSAQANLTTSFTFVSNETDTADNPLVSVSWSPQGTSGNDCVVTGTGSAGVICAETFDTQDLLRNLATGSNPSDLTYSYDIADLLTRFGIHVTGLPQGTYSLGLNSVTSANVLSVQAVPEPASLALVALGLLGMGFGLRRRSRNA